MRIATITRPTSVSRWPPSSPGWRTTFACSGPSSWRNPKTSMYRIYRDIRFSENKAPYKTHVAANFPTRGLPKHEGAGLYFHVSPDEVWIGGGMYAPPHVAASRRPRAHRREFQTPAHARRVAGVPPRRRGARGRTAAACAARFPEGSRRGGVSEVQTVPRRPRIRAGVRHQPEVLRGLLAVFRRVAPLMRFLNEPLTKSDEG